MKKRKLEIQWPVRNQAVQQHIYNSEWQEEEAMIQKTDQKKIMVKILAALMKTIYLGSEE